jgi:transcription antitermination factor NusG
LSKSQIYSETKSHPLPLVPTPEESNWYAIHTLARHEKRVAQDLVENKIRTFLPLLQQIHQWSDRRQRVEVPMFSCYAFVRVAQKTEERLKVLRTSGVLGFVGSDTRGTPIPEREIEGLQTAINEKIPCATHPFISAGQRVRIRGGSLDGVQGILTSLGGEKRVVVSVDLLQRSIALQVRGYDIEMV